MFAGLLPEAFADLVRFLPSQSLAFFLPNLNLAAFDDHPHIKKGIRYHSSLSGIQLERINATIVLRHEEGMIGQAQQLGGDEPWCIMHLYVDTEHILVAQVGDLVHTG